MMGFSLDGWGQSSILDQMMQTQASIVDVRARNSGLVTASSPAAAIDPRSGRLIVHRNVAIGAYERHGSGVIVHDSGVIVTNAHTVQLADEIQIVFADKTVASAQVGRVIKNLDLAILQVTLPFPLPPVAMANSDQIRLGEEIITIGSSTLLDQTVSGGTVIGIGTNQSALRQGERRTDLIQTTVNLYQGDSGGPLFDRQGRLIGLMTAKETSADHSSFAIPSNQIIKHLKVYLAEKHGQPQPR
jgi:S1-C subfamily serine protease